MTNTDRLAKVLDALADRSTNVLALLGAGVSTAAGIADFRGPRGLYSGLSSEVAAVLPSRWKPEDLFREAKFHEDPAPLMTLLEQIRSTHARPTPGHRLIAALADRGRLTRCVTQNIDGLEATSGIPEALMVHLHGRIPRCRRQGDSGRILAASGGNGDGCESRPSAAGVPPGGMANGVANSTTPPALVENYPDLPLTRDEIAESVVFFDGEVDLGCPLGDCSAAQPRDLLLILGTTLKVSTARAVCAAFPGNRALVSLGGGGMGATALPARVHGDAPGVWDVHLPMDIQEFAAHAARALERA